MATYEKLVIEAVFKLEKRELDSLKATGGSGRLMNWIEALSKQFLYKPLGFIESDYPTQSENVNKSFVYPGNPGSFMKWLLSQENKEIFVFMNEWSGFSYPVIKSAISVEKSKAKDFIAVNKKVPFEPGTTTFKVDISSTRIAEHYEEDK